MKKNLLFIVMMMFSAALMAQTAPVRFHRSGDRPVPVRTYAIGDIIPGQAVPNTTVSPKATLEDPVTGTTKYDLQTNAATQNRIYLYPDGTIGTTFTMSHVNTFSDRGTGYTYFDGTNWGDQPSGKIESVKAGWPSYEAFGPAGEIVVSHHFANFPLCILTRSVKGTGAWTETTLAPPSGAPGVVWPRMVTNGTEHTNIHIIGVTTPTANGGSVYQGMDGALVYNRSLDGGATWDGWQILPGMTSTEYPGISADSYAWAEPKGDTLCFVVGQSWYDQFIMKSNDNGATWTKTVIWPCPYNFWAGGDTTGIFYCPDGASAVALDKNGKAHVLFGLQRGMGDETGSKYWYPFTDGLIYWNEDKPELPEVLDPDWLDENGYVIGWVQDTMVWQAEETALAYYYNSMSSMPQLAFDDQDNAVAVWSSVTTLTDPNSFMLRHVFARKSQDGGATWNSEFVDLTSDLLYTWSECVYPSLSPTSNYFWHILFQADDYAGSYVQAPTQGQTDITDNSMTYLKFSKWTNGINDPCGQDLGDLRVSPVFPNPASANAFLNLDVTNSQRIRIELTSITGQVVREYQPGTLTAGVHRVKLDLTGLQPGIYQYTVIAPTGKASGKVIKTQE